MTRDSQGNPVQRWAAEVEYRGARECDALQIHELDRCLVCHYSSWEIGARRDGGTLAKLMCTHPSVPRANGLKVAEGGKCKNFWLKEV